MKILFACERSAGHIFPALVMGKKLRKQASVCFFATSSFLKKYIKDEGFACFGRSLAFRNLIIEGTWRLVEAIYLIVKLRPKKVIGFGGRDSFFLVLFSAFLSIETVIYEPNLEMGRANRFLAPFVSKILRGFEGEGSKSRTIGILLRENIKRIDKVRAREMLNFNNEPVIFCFGGSQGSAFLNQVFIKFIQNFKENCQIIHLTGKDKYSEILPLYNEIKNKSFVKDFYYDMAVLYSAADVIISRAGAAALGEISFYGLPAILLPLPAAGGHQEKNAFYLGDKGAAKVFLQDKFCFDDFSRLLSCLIQDADSRRVMSDNLSRIKLGVSYEDFDINNYL